MSQLALDFTSSCALDSGGVWCWGSGSIGIAGTTYSQTPVQVQGLPSVPTFITTGNMTDNGGTYLAIASGMLYAWGVDKNNVGQAAFRIDVSGLPSNIEFVTGYGNGGCIATKSKEVWCWGLNNQGQLGNGTFTDSASAVRVLPWAE